MASQGEDNAGNQLLNTGHKLLLDFISKRLGVNPEDLPTSSQLGETDLSDSDLEEIGNCLQKIGDELDKTELKKMINNPKVEPTHKVFWKVACEIFSDGKLRWGRVVALFYFACELIKKAAPNINYSVIGWTIDFMREHVIGWIREQGGWEAILKPSEPFCWQSVIGVLLGALSTVIVVNKCSLI